MKYKVLHPDSFIEAFFGCGPRKLIQSWLSKIRPIIEERGDVPDGNAVKKLNKYKHIYRYKSGSYRFIYYVDQKNKTIYMITFGDRKDIYKKIPSILDRFSKPEIIEDPKKITYQRKTVRLVSGTYSQKKPERFIDQITEINLRKWKIPKKHFSLILKCVSDNEILDLQDKLPNDIYELIIYLGKPPEPSKMKIRNIPDSQIEELIKNNIEVGDFKKSLFVLDHEQKKIVDKFINVKKGTWIVKGSAGTGKSIVLMNCAKALSDSVNPVPKILYTGYTKSLINLAQDIFKDSKKIETLTVWSLCEKILSWNSRKKGEKYKKLTEVSNEKMEEIFQKSLLKAEWDSNKEMQMESEDKRITYMLGEGASPKRRREYILGHSVLSKLFQFYGSFSRPDYIPQMIEFLYRELMEIVWGRNLSKKEYLHRYSRVGTLNNYCSKLIDPRTNVDHKELIWKFSQVLDEELNKEKIYFYDPRRFYEAKQVLDSNYDCPYKYEYVFYDEAQNLPKTALDMLFSLTTNNKMFIAADEGQNIYNSSFSSKYIPKNSNTYILKKQYRCTKEIQKALQGIIENSKTKDPLADKRKYSTSYGNGDIPEFFIYNKNKDSKSESNKIVNYLEDSMNDLGLKLSDAVVIVPSKKIGTILAKEINSTKTFTKLPYNQKARYAESSKFFLGYKGLNITNPYAVQGMEFPIVIVTDFDLYPDQKPTKAIKGRYFGVDINSVYPAHKGIPNYVQLMEEEIRMFYVSCSRAKTKLLVTSSMAGTSVSKSGDLISYGRPHWEIESLEEDMWRQIHYNFFDKVIDKKAWNFTMQK